MIDIPKYLPKEIIPQDELLAWRSTLKREEAKDCPLEVRQFIDAVASQLPDFVPNGRYTKTMITGYELRLAGMKEYNGEYLHDTFAYELPVPVMVAVDHRVNMHRSYRRRGKQGLVDYCRARVDAKQIDRLLKILDQHVFKEESAEFKKVMTQIKKAA